MATEMFNSSKGKCLHKRNSKFISVSAVDGMSKLFESTIVKFYGVARKRNESRMGDVELSIQGIMYPNVGLTSSNHVSPF